MRYGLLIGYRDCNDSLYSSLTSLTDRLWNLDCLTDTTTYMTIAVTNYYESRESHGTTTLNGLRNTLDGYDVVV